MWRSKNGSDWTAGFSSLGNLLPKPRLGGIANVPDFWRRTQTNLGADFLHFGDNQYFLGNFSRMGPGFGNTTFVPMTPVQAFDATGEESHGFYDTSTSRFIWYGCVNSGSVPAETNVPSWDGYITIPRHLSIDWSPSANGDFDGMVTFYPLEEIKTLRKRLLFSSADALRTGVFNGSDGELWLPTAAGTALDIEINITFPTSEDAAAAVPAMFGAVGVKVLGMATPPASPIAAAAAPPSPTQPVAFDLTKHGPGVTIDQVKGRAGSIAIWGGAAVGSKSPGTACNQVALLTNSSRSFWMVLGQRANPWTDLGWCSSSLDTSGKSWAGPKPSWIGYQGKGAAWLYRSTGLFKASSAPDHDQGIAYGKAFGSGNNVTAIRHAPIANGGPWALEFLVDGKSQGKVTLKSGDMAGDMVGCVAACGGGEVATIGGEHWPVPPPGPPPPPAPRPPAGGGAELLISSTGSEGEISFGRDILEPAGRKPRPTSLALRVLVDRSIIEAFAQRGRRSVAFPIYTGGNATALVWRPNNVSGSAPAAPKVSIAVWAMSTGYFE